MNDMKDLRRQLLFKAKEQRNKAWVAKNYEKSEELRKEEEKNYDKWKLLNGIIKAIEKGNKNNVEK